jgi:hypothetical protein
MKRLPELVMSSEVTLVIPFVLKNTFWLSNHPSLLIVSVPDS